MFELSAAPGGTPASIHPKWERRQRTLHVLDIENLVGEEHALGDAETFQRVLADYTEASGMRDDDPVMVGCHPGLVFVAQETLGQRGQIFARRGENGADLALLSAIDIPFIANRFHLVSLGSGDGIFAPVVCELVEVGVLVTVIGRRDHTSGALQAAATDCILIEPSDAVALGTPGKGIEVSSADADDDEGASEVA